MHLVPEHWPGGMIWINLAWNFLNLRKIRNRKSLANYPRQLICIVHLNSLVNTHLVLFGPARNIVFLNDILINTQGWHPETRHRLYKGDYLCNMTTISDMNRVLNSSWWQVPYKAASFKASLSITRSYWGWRESMLSRQGTIYSITQCRGATAIVAFGKYGKGTFVGDIEYLGSWATTPAVVFCWHLAELKGLKRLLEQRGAGESLVNLTRRGKSPAFVAVSCTWQFSEAYTPPRSSIAYFLTIFLAYRLVCSRGS